MITDQIDLFTLQVDVAKLFVRDAQEKSYLRPCRLGALRECWVCKAKRYILRERFL